MKPTLACVVLIGILSTNNPSRAQLAPTSIPDAGNRTPKEEIELLADGAAARFGPHQVTFAADAQTAGAVELRLPGLLLRTHVIGLCFYSDTGEGVLIAGLKPRVGELLSTNQVVYRDAFDGITADLVYTYTAASPPSLEQDIVVRRQLPAPTSYNLEAERVRLATVSEFIDSPEPRRTVQIVSLRERFPALGILSDESLADETLDFGPVRVAAGRAFTLGETGEAIPVVKNWQSLGERRFLIESTPYRLIAPLLEKLPAEERTASIRRRPQALSTVLLGERLQARAGGPSQPMILAQSGLSAQPGVVLDYLMVVNQEAQGAAADADTDADGIPDNWELQHFGNLDRDGRGDRDGDGVSDLQECQAGMNPRNLDSNGDGIIDQARKARVTRPSAAASIP